LRLSFSNVLVFLAILISLATFFGQNQLTFYLTFLKPEIINGFLSFIPIEKTYLEGFEFWRLLSPIFLHFSVAHLAFNSLWIYILGTRIEDIEGYKKLIFLILFSGILSNFAESAVSGAIIFGGLSGCVYALLGFAYGMPPAIYIFMIVWLALGYLDILNLFGFGKIANTAHLTGLICGISFALIKK
jgi:GlpG protein